jgi:hypothetical protein
MISPHDRTILRDLARRVADAAALPVMAERRREWVRHNGLRPGRPMILIFPEGGWRELMPPESLACEGDRARQMEGDLCRRLYTHEHFRDDAVVEAEWLVPKAVRTTGWGLAPEWRDAPTPTGAGTFQPVIHTAADLAKLRFPRVSHDEAATADAMDEALELFGDILRVEARGAAHVSFHLMSIYTHLRGLEEVMLDMVLAPAMLHDAMAFLEEGHRRLIAQYEALNLLSPNHDGTYHSSGGVGYTDELPAPGFDPGRVRPRDMWASAEAQELAQVSPRMHAEFSMEYEKRLLAPFGLTGYGCCEDLTRKLDDVLAIPHIRRISIAPTADVAACAAKIGRRAIFSWKPNPAHLVGAFNEPALRAYIAHTLDVAAGGCALEMILKDTHTCEGRPERFDRWAEIARQCVDAL